MPAPESVQELVQRYTDNEAAYKSGTKSETELRVELIDRLFEALGWDVNNRRGYADAYKDVIHEDKVLVNGRMTAPDYSFRIGQTRKFFVEAKGPGVKIKTETAPAFQLRRYAWSAKLPLSILTNFEYLAVYDGRIQPSKDDGPGVARLHCYHCTEFLAKWDEIDARFSKEAVLKGAFDRFADDRRPRRGTSEVDSVFLTEIEGWRKRLAESFAAKNSMLTTRQLNYAVQKTIDRLIFLRICEDRGIEEFGRLQSLLNKKNIYEGLVAQFREADERYNSGLFHFEREKGRDEEDRDTLTLALKIDDGILEDILKSLYYPSPYAFDVFPADILGQVYEQFLGKVIILDAKHRATVETKPEVRKAGGVYYTPTYVVDFIVEQTVNQGLLGKSPKQAETLKILDPACGSGSFLIHAYQALLDWHLRWYEESGVEKHARSKEPKVYQTQGGNYRLTTTERRRILLNSIYGVDVDPQAVEVTKLSLLLKLLEGETSQTVKAQTSLSLGRVLPDLGGNIKCGNSLIASDFYNHRQMTLLDDEEMYRVNAFDWNKAYPKILEGPLRGFDAIIGNPPYIPIEAMPSIDREYFQLHYPELERKYDSSIVFILSCINKLNPNGRLGFISSLTWQTGENFRQLRKTLFNKAGVETIVNLPFNVFNAYVDTGIYILTSKPAAQYNICRLPKKQAISSLQNITYTAVSRDLVVPPDYKVVLEPMAQGILARLCPKTGFTTLGEITESTQGLAGKRFTRVSDNEGTNIFPFLERGQVYRYAFERGEIVKVDMSEHESLKPYYEAAPKILIRRVINRQDRLMATCTSERLVVKKDLNPFIVTRPNYDVMYLLGIINSRLISYLYVNTSSIATKDDFRQTTLAELRRLPIPAITIKDPHGARIVSLVQQMLDLNMKASTADPTSRMFYKRRLEATDVEIDRLVYKMYMLKQSEIDAIEVNEEPSHAVAPLS